MDVSEDVILTQEDWGAREYYLNVWLGEGSALSALTEPVFLIITGKDTSKHMLIINIE